MRNKEDRLYIDKENPGNGWAKGKWMVIIKKDKRSSYVNVKIILKKENVEGEYRNIWFYLIGMNAKIKKKICNNTIHTYGLFVFLLEMFHILLNYNCNIKIKITLNFSFS